MHRPETVHKAFELAASGMSPTQIARVIDVPRATVRDWVNGRARRVSHGASCARCGAVHSLSDLDGSYVYLLGLYLGDGCLSEHAREVYRLRITLDTAYPGIIDEASRAIHEVRGRPAHLVRCDTACIQVSSYWKAWPCLFPQHGAGKKHERKIALEAWQLGLADRWPELLLRGLIHSDGCRFQSTGRGWSWPRYSFYNRSEDIRDLFSRACDRLGLRWTTSGKYTLYVSRKADVAALDHFIGPKR